MNILVIGASGQVGGAIFNKLKDSLIYKDIIINGTYSSFKGEEFYFLDISNRKMVETFLEKMSPDIIFLSGAVTNVDLCEEKPEETYKVNVLGVKNIIDLASTNCRIVFFSTDFIFNGEKGLYIESDVPSPISQYGHQKLLAEHYVAAQAQHFNIIRTNVVYGPEKQNKNFAARLIKNLRDNKEVTVPQDEFGTPTYGPDLAERAIDIALHKPNGIYHVSGSQLISRYRFALEVADIFGYDINLIKPVNSVDLKRPAKRPLSAGLLSNKIELNMGYKNGLLALYKIFRGV